MKTAQLGCFFILKFDRPTKIINTFFELEMNPLSFAFYSSIILSIYTQCRVF